MSRSSNKSLKRNFLWAFFVVTFLSSLGFAALIAYSSESLEYALLDNLVKTEADFIEEFLTESGASEIPPSAGSYAWLDDGATMLPSAISQLPLGLHHEIDIYNGEYHVLKRHSDHGILTVAIEITAVEQREEELHTRLAFGVLFFPSIMMILALFLTKRLTAPLVRLASDLKTRDPSQPASTLAPAYPHLEIRPLVEAIDDYQERLEQVLKRERMFAASASHELRTPLSIISSGLEVLSLSDLPEETQNPLERTRRAAGEMQALIEGLLTLVRSHKAPSEQITVSEVITASCDGYQNEFNKRGIALTVSCDNSKLAADPIHIAIMVSNVLRNVLYHMVPMNDEPPKVAVTLADGVLAISDNGATPDIADLSSIFRLGNKNPASEGVGLGLYIVSQITQQYGWTLTAKRNSPHGLMIEIVLTRVMTS